MKQAPVPPSEEANWLCMSLYRGGSYKIRKEIDITKHFKDEEEVEIVDFVDEARPPGCINAKARLLKFKCHSDKGRQWHPIWITNCHECPSYDPTFEESGRRSRRSESKLASEERRPPVEKLALIELEPEEEGTNE